MQNSSTVAAGWSVSGGVKVVHLFSFCNERRRVRDLHRGTLSEGPSGLLGRDGATPLCDRVAVIYRGEIVEMAATDAIFGAPQHGYTRQLPAAAPNLS